MDETRGAKSDKLKARAASCDFEAEPSTLLHVLAPRVERAKVREWPMAVNASVFEESRREPTALSRQQIASLCITIDNNMGIIKI